MAHHAWYSSRQAYEFGHATYKTTDGRVVVASAISPSKDDSLTRWDDIRYVGEVIELLEVYDGHLSHVLDSMTVDVNTRRHFELN
jgi:hypothetical protein